MSITGTDVMWTELNDTPFFDFSATSIENYPFTDSDLDALRNLAVLIDTAKVLNQMHEKKPLRRDLIDFIIDTCILEEAKNGDSILGHSEEVNLKYYTFEDREYLVDVNIKVTTYISTIEKKDETGDA